MSNSIVCFFGDLSPPFSGAMLPPADRMMLMIAFRTVEQERRPTRFLSPWCEGL
jgi:hypothetical protein